MLVSTTLTGNSERFIADALLSVAGFVDQCLVIDTGVTDRTLEVAREAVGDKLLVRRFPWCHDFAAARNAALDFAEEAGATWALTVDSDERIVFKPAWSLAELDSDAERSVLFTYFHDQSYTKERFIRTGRGVRWQGPIHETTNEDAYERVALTLNVAFTELVKNPAQSQHKNLRDLPLLQAYAAQHPQEARWTMYVGFTLRNMLRYEEAIEPLWRAIELERWTKFHAQAAIPVLYQCFTKLNRWEEAVTLCEQALLANPGETKYAKYRDMALHKAKLHREFGLPV